MTDSDLLAPGWHAVDALGRDLHTGRPPTGRGWASPAAAVAAAPTWALPLWARAADGRRVSLGQALGPGGGRVETLLDALLAARPVDPVDVPELARATPAGAVDLPVAVVTLPEGAQAAEGVDPGWFGAVDRRRTSLRRALVDAGREAEVEAALHVALLVSTERLDPGDDTDVDAHVASGARLWLVAGAVVSALEGADGDPFGPWARLVAGGWWPVGPCAGRLVVSGPEVSARASAAATTGGMP